jgi:DEAD/DEAH box helicase domain-containing protein
MIVPASIYIPSIDIVIEEIMQQEWYKDQIIDRRVFDEKGGTIGMIHQNNRRRLGVIWRSIIAALDPPLSETIMKALQDSRKITALYSHQAAAIDAIARGRNVIVSTSTASGKSVIYQVPTSFNFQLFLYKWDRRFVGSSAEIPSG